MRAEKFSHIVREEVALAMARFAKGRPETLFEQVFYDIREKAKDIKEGLEDKAKGGLESKVVSDLQGKGVRVNSAKMSLGKYRGSRFVTSFKLSVVAGDEAEAEKIAEYLRGKYSPKWKVKSFDNNVAELNIR